MLAKPKMQELHSCMGNFQMKKKTVLNKHASARQSNPIPPPPAPSSAAAVEEKVAAAANVGLPLTFRMTFNCGLSSNPSAERRRFVRFVSAELLHCPAQCRQTSQTSPLLGPADDGEGWRERDAMPGTMLVALHRHQGHGFSFLLLLIIGTLGVPHTRMNHYAEVLNYYPEEIY